MGPAAADRALPAGSGFRFEKHGVHVGKIIEFESRNFSSDEMLDRLQGRDLFAIHQGEGIANILRATSAADAVDVIFRMLGHIVIDDVTDAGDIESDFCEADLC